jgi:hypothetical protein
VQVTEEMQKIPSVSRSDIRDGEMCRRGVNELGALLIEPISHRLLRST